jgi:hypothetical protein
LLLLLLLLLLVVEHNVQQPGDMLDHGRLGVKNIYVKN